MICRKCGADVPDAPFCCQCGTKQEALPKRTRRGNGEGRVWKRGKSWYAQITLYTETKEIDGKKLIRQKRKTKGGFRTKKEPFTEDEVKRIWDAFAGGDVFAGYPLLMIYSGMMQGKLLSCKKEMVDLDRCEIWGCGKKTAKCKETPIVFPEFVRPVAETLIENAGSGEKLLQMNRDNFYARYYEELEKIGVRRLPPYSCRHTTGTEAAKQNLAAPVIQSIMRHAKLTTSQKYIHLASDDAHRGVNQLKK